jgi:hypothetical protein
MKTKWIASREFSASPGRALAAVTKAGRVLVTANGKPRAIMIPTTEESFASDLELLDRVDLARTIANIRTEAVLKGTDRLTMKDINAEIAAARAARKRR